MLTKLLSRLSPGLAIAALSLWLPTTPAVADPVISRGTANSSCVGTDGSLSCVTRWHKVRGESPPVRTEQDLTEAAERDRKWVARCRPIVRQDRFGVDRYHYAAPGCEFGKTED